MSSKGISNVEQLAELLGCSKSTVAHAMAGKRPPSVEVIAAIKLRLGLPWDFIIEAVESQSGKQVAKPRIVESA